MLNTDKKIHIVGFSGGIDSQACAIWVKNHFPNDTIVLLNSNAGGNESPITEKLSAIDWVIVGGESGHNARPMHPDWAYSLRDQCNEAGVPFLFKQWGDWHPAMGDTSQDRLAICKHTGGSFHISAGEFPRMFDMLDRCQMHRVGKKAAGRMLAGREWNGVPA